MLEGVSVRSVRGASVMENIPGLSRPGLKRGLSFIGNNEIDFFEGTRNCIALLGELFRIPYITDPNFVDGNSHTKRLDSKHRVDNFTLHGPFNYSLRVYVTDKGIMSYSLATASSSPISKSDPVPKALSTGTRYGDALRSRVSIEGPTEDEELVVIKDPEAKAIGVVDGQEILGFVLTPDVRRDTRTVHGKMELLVRKKPIITLS